MQAAPLAAAAAAAAAALLLLLLLLLALLLLLLLLLSYIHIELCQEALMIISDGAYDGWQLS
jgi:hypothetical protein